MCELDEAAEAQPATKPSRRSLLAAGGGLIGGLVVGGAAGRSLGSSSSPVPTQGATRGATRGATGAVSPVPTNGLSVVLLGTAGGPPPRPGEVGIGSAVVVDGAVYVVDAGRSVLTQYVNAGLKLADLSAMFLTHLHADHVADYFNFFLCGGWSTPGQGDTVPGPTPVYGPGRAGGLAPAFNGQKVTTVNPHAPTPGLRDLTDGLSDAYAYSTNVFLRDSAIRDPRALIDVREIGLPPAATSASFTNTHPTVRPWKVMEDDRVRVTATLVPHGPVFPAFAYRFETDHGSVTFSGDTTYSDNLLTIAHETDLLVHEAINLEGFQGPAAVVDHMLTSHVKVQDVGTIAQKAGAKKLALSHIGNINGTPIDNAQWASWAKKGYDGQVHVGSDLDVLTKTGA